MAPSSISIKSPRIINILHVGRASSRTAHLVRGKYKIIRNSICERSADSRLLVSHSNGSPLPLCGIKFIFNRFIDGVKEMRSKDDHHFILHESNLLFLVPATPSTAHRKRIII